MAVAVPPPGTHPQLKARGWAAALGAVCAAGFALIIVAWAQARDTVVVEDQVNWAALGLAGASAVGLSAVGGLTLVRRAVRLRLYALNSALERYLPVDLPARVDGTGGAGPGAEGLRVTAAGMRHYHLASCPLVAGKPGGTAATAEQFRMTGLAPCGVCEA